MRKYVQVILFLFGLSAFLYAADSGTIVSVYTGASEHSAGRSAGRSSITSIKLGRFLDTDRVQAADGGIGTAVIISSRVKDALENLLSEQDYFIVEDSVFSRETDYGDDVYGFVWDEYGFEIVFSLERLTDKVKAEIEKVYGDDAWLYGELIRSYSDNYSIRVFEAEDVINPEAGRMDFLDAMISATVIGDSFQPLLGIHNGLGVLDDLGLAVARAEVTDSGRYNEYRKFESDEDEIESFMHSILNMNGDFVDNLFNAVADITRKLPEDGKFSLPEVFFRTRQGDNDDYAMFFYDILRRNGYQVKLVVIDRGDGELYTTVFFREKGADLWGWIDSNAVEREKAENWRRLPALVFSGTVDYFEPVVGEILKTGILNLPPPSDWFTSLF